MSSVRHAVSRAAPSLAELGVLRPTPAGRGRNSGVGSWSSWVTRQFGAYETNDFSYSRPDTKQVTKIIKTALSTSSLNDSKPTDLIPSLQETTSHADNNANLCQYSANTNDSINAMSMFFTRYVC